MSGRRNWSYQKLPEPIRKAYLRWNDVRDIKKVLKKGVGRDAKYWVYIKSGGGEKWWKTRDGVWHYEVFYTERAA